MTKYQQLYTWRTVTGAIPGRTQSPVPYVLYATRSVHRTVTTHVRLSAVGRVSLSALSAPMRCATPGHRMVRHGSR